MEMEPTSPQIWLARKQQRQGAASWIRMPFVTGIIMIILRLMYSQLYPVHVHCMPLLAVGCVVTNEAAVVHEHSATCPFVPEVTLFLLSTV